MPPYAEVRREVLGLSQKSGLSTKLCYAAVGEASGTPICHSTLYPVFLQCGFIFPLSTGEPFGYELALWCALANSMRQE